MTKVNPSPDVENYTVSAGGTKRWYLDEKLHRVGGPAVEYTNGEKYWYLNGLLHREDGPAVERSVDKDEVWYLNGKRHREDGPAVVYGNGAVEWWLNGQLHREGAPAVEYTNGVKEWWLHGFLHREDGPAIESEKRKEWCIQNQRYSKEEYIKILQEIDSLEPMIGLTDKRTWIRERWKRILNNRSKG